MKSSSRVGPRSPALSECWLSATGTPWFVVSVRLDESTRTRSRGPMVLFAPTTGEPLPVFSEPLVSVTVLDPTIGSSGLTDVPTGGASSGSLPYSSGLLALNGVAAARASVPAAFAVRSSRELIRASGFAGPETVARLLRSTPPVSGFFGDLRALAMWLPSVGRSLSDDQPTFGGMSVRLSARQNCRNNGATRSAAVHDAGGTRDARGGSKIHDGRSRCTEVCPQRPPGS